jgi:flagellar biosynthesis anti-sigma factor FlgM
VASTGASPSARVDAAPRAAPNPHGLEVSISPQVETVSQAREVVATLPETRIHLVQGIQIEVEEGRYSRDSNVIAKKMINEALRESVRRRATR